jgi:predicted phosphoadenosine phosphosulfate sulfurtransferase
MSVEIVSYIREWKKRGYKKDIPQECPDSLSREGLAPSYKAICLAILSNDLKLRTISQPIGWREAYRKTKSLTTISQREPELPL